MLERSKTIPQHKTKDQPCPCGCASCEDECCQLNCLERPRFYCGQLLSDQDLTALVDWIQDKSRLTRYRDGWGVACGLDVRCDPDQRGQIIVSPGYAVSCCGDDIIVCKDDTLDLRRFCQIQEEPCEDPWAKESATSEDGEKERQRHYVDVFIRYKEQATDPQTALGRCGCREVGECVCSRTLETHHLFALEVDASSDPMEQQAGTWLRHYKKCLKVLKEFLELYPRHDLVKDENGNYYLKNYEDSQRKVVEMSKERRKWLLEWVKKNPLRHFCCLEDTICDLTDWDLMSHSQELQKVLFYIVQDCRNAFLTCNCHNCQEGHGVPLARVVLESWRDEDGMARCKVASIDPYPPFRRSLGPDCWPAKLGAVNIGRVIWHRYEEACTILADLGLHLVDDIRLLPFSNGKTLSDLISALDNEPMISCGQKVIAQVVEKDSVLRVVGILPAPQEPKWASAGDAVLVEEYVTMDEDPARYVEQVDKSAEYQARNLFNEETIKYLGKKSIQALHKHDIKYVTELCQLTPEQFRDICQESGVRNVTRYAEAIIAQANQLAEELEEYRPR